MKYHPTLPTFGAPVPGAGGVLGAIMRGALIGDVREPDYAVIVPTGDNTDIAPIVWGTYGKEVPNASSLTDGRSNTAAMLAARSPAAQAVAKLKHGGLADWYIPSRAEMWALRANVPELFAKEWYWTSTQNASYGAIAQRFAYGGSHWLTKDYELRVRPVRMIQLQHFTA